MGTNFDDYDWPLVDRAFEDPTKAAVAQRLLDLVHSGWTDDAQFDLGDRATESILNAHRVSTLIPMRYVVADHRETFRDRLIHINGVQLRIESAAKDVLAGLNEAGIESRVLKGLASADLDYPSPNLRQTGDVDLLVPADQLDEAARVLRQRGFREHAIRPRSKHLLKGITLVASSGVEIDLHSRLELREPRRDRLFETSGVPLSNLPGLALPLEERIVHAAAHFLSSSDGHRRLSGLADVTVMHDRHCVDLDRALEVATDLRAAALVGAALRLEATLTHRTEVLDALQKWPAPDWLDRATFLSVRRRPIFDHIALYREVPANLRLGYLPYWLIPGPTARRDLRTSMTRKWGAFAGRVQSVVRKPNR